MQEALFHTAIRRELGPVVLAAFADEDVTDIYTNVDGSLWCDTHSRGRYLVPNVTVSPECITRFLNVLATSLEVELGHTQLHLDAELPVKDFGQARVCGWMPPLTEKPVVIIRKHSSEVYSLEELARGGLFPKSLLSTFKDLVANGDSILVVGPAKSGKTTFLNALLDAHAQLETEERLITVEDTLELQLSHLDVLRLRASPDYDFRELIKGCLRSDPDRIIVGEVRDASALDLLDAWATGHRGGFGTLHAESVQGAILRLDRLAQRNRVPSQRNLIFEAVNWILVLGFESLQPQAEEGLLDLKPTANRKRRRLTELARLRREDQTIDTVYKGSGTHHDVAFATGRTEPEIRATGSSGDVVGVCERSRRTQQSVRAPPTGPSDGSSDGLSKES